MRRSTTFVACSAMLCGLASQVNGAPIEVSFGDVPVDVTPIGMGQQGAASGSEFAFSGFDPSQFTQLYFSVKPSALPTVTFNGTPTTLPFAEVQGTTAIWQGSADVSLNGSLVTVPLRFTLDVTGLGGNPWIDPASVGLPPAIGAAISDPTGADFNALIHFQADYGSGFGPLAPAPFGSSGGSVGSSVGGAFFVVRPTPEPGTLMLGIVGAGVLLVRGRRLLTR